MREKENKELDHVRDTLNTLSSIWRTRAIVNSGAPEQASIRFENSKPDFSELLLPFRFHPRWLEAEPHLKSALLSYGWALYNLKTIYVECDVVTPACEDLIKFTFCRPEVRFELQNVISETLLDEALHTRMSVLACNIVYQNRKLQPIEFTDFNLVKWRRDLVSQCDSDSKRRLTRLAIATASETLITDYLKTLSQDDSIQPVCREVTRAHALDEWAHSSVFSVVAEHVLGILTLSERRFFASILPRAVDAFADTEMQAWSFVFDLVGFQHGREIVADSQELSNVKIYRESVSDLLKKIGLDTHLDHRLGY